MGRVAFCPWNDVLYNCSILQLNLGSNPISSLEVVSSLNSFNLTYGMYYYSYDSRTKKYNPKVYLGAVQTTSGAWNLDRQNAQNWVEKSGSWPQVINKF